MALQDVPDEGTAEAAELAAVATAVAPSLGLHPDAIAGDPPIVHLRLVATVAGRSAPGQG